MHSSFGKKLAVLVSSYWPFQIVLAQHSVPPVAKRHGFLLQHPHQAARTNRVTVPVYVVLDALRACGGIGEIGVKAYGTKDRLGIEIVGGRLSLRHPEIGERNRWLYNLADGASALTVAVGINFG